MFTMSWQIKYRSKETEAKIRKIMKPIYENLIYILSNEKLYCIPN
jgi:hypothetical protein